MTADTDIFTLYAYYGCMLLFIYTYLYSPTIPDESKWEGPKEWHYAYSKRTHSIVREHIL